MAVRRLSYLWKALAAGLMVSTTATLAHAGNFTNTTVGAIGNATACAGAPNFGATLTTANLTRTFTVTGEPDVVDLGVGLIASHTWRGDMRVILRPPSGAANQVTLITDDNSGAGNDDNYNIRLSDQATPIVNTGTHDVANNTALAPYQFTVAPNTTNPLSSFNGINPNGTWSLIICDNAGTEEGQFLRGELLFATPVADLSLTVATANPTPTVLSNISIAVNVQNAGPNTANATAQVNLPAGLTYVSHTGPGTYNPGTGLWTLPTNLANGANTQLNIVATVQSMGSYTTTAQIASSNATDPDSTPGNNSTTEDDDASLTITPQTGPAAPNLTCPVADRFTHTWSAPGSTNGWAAGTLTNSYTAGGLPISLTMSGNTNRFIARTFNGSTLQTPVTTTQFANGANAGNHGVVMNVDYAATTENIVTTMNLGNPGQGVGQLQFQILDVDLGTWTDRITINGSFNGTSVTPTLTSSASNTVVPPNRFLGTAGAVTGNPAGNTTVTFLNPVDVVTFTYDNASPTVDPASQVISLQRLLMCQPLLADVTAEKTVEVFDPGNLGLYMTPGNEVLYKITVTNSDTATAQADDIDITDTLPPNLTFVSATTTGFTGGAFGSPDLPATNTDCGATPCVIRYSGGTVPIDATAEIAVRALIK